MKSLTNFGILFIFLSLFQHSFAQNLEWVKKIDATIAGGGGTNSLSIKTDLQGNVYTLGMFYGTMDFDPGPMYASLTATAPNETSYDLFITKFDSLGNFIWAKNLDVNDYWFYCGCAQSYPYPQNFNDGYYLDYTLSIDDNGNVHIMGIYQGTVDFDPGPNVNELTSNGIYDVFVCKLDTDGNFLWAKSVGGPSYDSGTDMTTDNTGNVYVTGYYRGSADFDPGNSTLEFNSQNNKDAFILKLNSTGDLVWAKTTSAYLAGSISVDASGNVYYGGNCEPTTDLDPGSGIVNLNASGSSFYSFLSKLNSNGNFIWAKPIYNSNFIKDVNNNFFVQAKYIDTVDFDLGPGVSSLISSSYDSTQTYKEFESVIIKYSSSGDFLWAKPIIGIGQFNISNINTDTDGNFYAAGNIRGTFDFDPSTSVHSLTTGYFESNLMLLKWDNNGNYISSTILIEPVDFYNGFVNSYLHVDIDKNVYCTGTFTDEFDFDPSSNSTIVSGNNSYNSIFITKYSQCFDGTINISLNGNTYTTNAVADNYQWIDCSNNIEIEGETGQSFSPTESGNYAVTISVGTCSKISDCISTIVGLNEIKNQLKILFYPNPSTDFIHFNKEVKMVEISDVTGTIVSISANITQIDVSKLASGTYIVEGTTNDEEVFSSKFIKK